MENSRETKQTEKQDSKELFLKAFVNSLILNFPLSEIPQIENEKAVFQPLQASYQAKQQLQPSILSPIPSMMTPSYALSQLPYPMPAKHYPIPQPFIEQQISSTPLQRLLPYLNDMSVGSIECPGPGRNIIINRQGMLQASQIVLTQDEINAIIQDISEKTRIPLVQGVFKALIGNLIITAVISEFVGTRFLMEKRQLAPQYRPYY